jgi:hypothetical protein
MLAEARLLDRVRFAHRFEGGPAELVERALVAYQNADGGFGNALEPDIRGEASQPVPLEHAFQVLDEIGRFDTGILEPACEWLVGATTAEGGVPFVLPTVVDGPHAEWWVPTGKASLNPTAGIAGLLHKHRVQHPWLERATDFCWHALDTELDTLDPDGAISVLPFLEHAPDRERATKAFSRLGARITRELVAANPDAAGYVKSPLDFAPRPTSLARTLFDTEMIERHLEALAQRQQPDGGWPITWEPPSRAAVNEWRGFVTLKSLDVLAGYADSHAL